jgi:hypothetical protein
MGVFIQKNFLARMKHEKELTNLLPKILNRARPHKSISPILRRVAKTKSAFGAGGKSKTLPHAHWRHTAKSAKGARIG